MKDIDLRKELNFRDLGGMLMADGRMLRRGLFYRSSGLYRYTPEELHRFNSLYIRNIIDLRTERECQKNPEQQLIVCRYFRADCCCKNTGIDFSPSGMMQIGEDAEIQLEKLRNYYLTMPYNNDAFRLILSLIRQKDLPLLFHCATGKDRTGVISAMILLMLGASDQLIRNDYLLSNGSYRQRIREVLDIDRQRTDEHPEYRRLLLMLRGVDPNIIILLLKQLHEQYPDIRDFFLEQYGISYDELQEIRNFCLTKPKE